MQIHRVTQNCQCKCCCNGQPRAFQFASSGHCINDNKLTAVFITNAYFCLQLLYTDIFCLPVVQSTLHSAKLKGTLVRVLSCIRYSKKVLWHWSRQVRSVPNNPPPTTSGTSFLPELPSLPAYNGPDPLFDIQGLIPTKLLLPWLMVLYTNYSHILMHDLKYLLIQCWSLTKKLLIHPNAASLKL